MEKGIVQATKDAGRKFGEAVGLLVPAVETLKNDVLDREPRLAKRYAELKDVDDPDVASATAAEFLTVDRELRAVRARADRNLVKVFVDADARRASAAAEADTKAATAMAKHVKAVIELLPDVVALNRKFVALGLGVDNRNILPGVKGVDVVTEILRQLEANLRAESLPEVSLGNIGECTEKTDLSESADWRQRANSIRSDGLFLVREVLTGAGLPIDEARLREIESAHRNNQPVPPPAPAPSVESGASVHGGIAERLQVARASFSPQVSVE